MTRHRCWVPAAILLSLAVPAGAQTVPDEDAKTAARTLAETGKKRFQSGDYAGAIQALTDAEKYFHAPTITRMRALAHENLGQLLEARALHRQIADENLAAGAPAEFTKAREEAKNSLVTLEKRIPKVVIALPHAPAGTRVSLDGKVLDAATLAAPLRMNPGKHALTIEPPNGQKIRREVDLRETSVETVEVDLAPPPAVTAAPNATVALPIGSPPEGASSPPPPARSILGPAIAFGAGGAGLVVGAITGGMTLAKAGEIRALCGGDLDCPESARTKVGLDGAKGIGYVSTAAFVVAGVGAAVGVVLLVLPAGKKDAPPRAAVTAAPGFVGVRGAF